MILSGYSGFLQHWNWSPWYSWNIADSDVKYQNSNSKFKFFKFSDEPILYFVAIEDMYPIIKQSHTAVGHGGLHKTYNDLKTHYANISREVIKTFLKLCEHCALKKKTFWAFKTSHQTSQILVQEDKLT